MPTVAAIAEFLERYAPPHLAEEWDNVGLLVGDPDREIRRAMTCLTITGASAQEAVANGADLIVAHHPLPFQAVKRVTTQTTIGRLLLELVAARIAVYSPHTAFDSAPEGINQRLAQGLELQEIMPLVPSDQGLTTGRRGSLPKPIPVEELADRLKKFLSVERIQIAAKPAQLVRSVAIGCGAADELLAAAVNARCDCMVLGEARFHTCLEAHAVHVALLLPGHFASERFALECLAHVLTHAFPDLHIWASRHEQDPLRWH